MPFLLDYPLHAALFPFCYTYSFFFSSLPSFSSSSSLATIFFFLVSFPFLIILFFYLYHQCFCLLSASFTQLYSISYCYTRFIHTIRLLVAAPIFLTFSFFLFIHIYMPFFSSFLFFSCCVSPCFFLFVFIIIALSKPLLFLFPVFLFFSCLFCSLQPTSTFFLLCLFAFSFSLPPFFLFPFLLRFPFFFSVFFLLQHAFL